MTREDAVEDAVEATSDQEPDVEGHTLQDAVEDAVEATDDQEPDVEGHGMVGDAVENVVEEAVE
jgi:hypothetical protein